MNDQPVATVYYDGSCPLCRAEIAHYRGQKGGDSICFLDASSPDTVFGPDLDKSRALGRLHVRGEDGGLVSGAAAFVSIWRHLPRLRWMARVASVPGVLRTLEVGYRLILPIRPRLARLYTRLRRDRPPSDGTPPRSTGTP